MYVTDNQSISHRSSSYLITYHVTLSWRARSTRFETGELCCGKMSRIEDGFRRFWSIYLVHTRPCNGNRSGNNHANCSGDLADRPCVPFAGNGKRWWATKNLHGFHEWVRGVKGEKKIMLNENNGLPESLRKRPQVRFGGSYYLLREFRTPAIVQQIQSIERKYLFLFSHCRGTSTKRRVHFLPS